ncbi:GNAT family N-acetyltransferase [Teredinibacter sp. KSP-S5-2]|uniref:GNAT family N-acetyltransferase n=1 Tax=Teredinibacter sp. KSP-S5-2 TaxID=3034506 RepID=UPI0029344B78|nr:GNAT family N-acetyltransferase [Teredinibacter sp. KSP-S5-2]WNO08799.1 GNAT family N-acetyltransferase [Teredinibacter sp. KSP-S5-2]
MTDMVVKLYDNPLKSDPKVSGEHGISIRRGMALDKQVICDFVDQHFRDVSPGWVDECAAALLRQPSSCMIAVHEQKVVGFCCYDATAKGMIGPLGVDSSYRGKGIATELLYECIQAMKADGYAYAVIGWVSSEDFYARACGAVSIPDSHPGVYSRKVVI